QPRELIGIFSGGLAHSLDGAPTALERHLAPALEGLHCRANRRLQVVENSIARTTRRSAGGRRSRANRPLARRPRGLGEGCLGHLAQLRRKLADHPIDNRVDLAFAENQTALPRLAAARRRSNAAPFVA